MPMELGIWRIDKELSRLEVKSLNLEDRLEEFLDKDINIASPNWMIIGRQVHTDYGQYIDLLGIDRDGNLVVLELKRHMTPREVVAQLLDYASWVKGLKDDEIASIYEKYLDNYYPEKKGTSLDQAFMSRFKLNEMPEELNESHQLVVVASNLDDSTERIVTYLSEEHNVPINAIYFRVFHDDEREYLSSIWFIDPTIPAPPVSGEDKEPWNGEFYVSYGHDENGRRWEDAVKYGYVSGGGGSWYSRTLNQLEVGKRIWVNVPGRGYVGVGVVLDPMVKVNLFTVKQKDGSEKPLTSLDVLGKRIFTNIEDDDKAEYLVRVKWIKTVPLDKAIKEKGFFGNQNTVCKPLTKKWQHTVDRLKTCFGIE
jgi:hypothetical protein